MAFAKQLGNLLKEILIEIRDGESRIGLLSKVDCESLLRENDSLAVEGEPISLSLNSVSSSSYPAHPLYLEIANRLSFWQETGIHPAENLKEFSLLEETERVSSELTLQMLLVELTQSWDTMSMSKRKSNLVKLLEMFKIRNYLDLLGVRHTAGSIDVFPPPSSLLVKSFNQKNKPVSSSLSVGARALSKHCHRDSSTAFWGECTGPEQAKNTHANDILCRILSDAAWVNIHLLPHDIRVLEVRCSEGYGARWSHDGTEFRGFLEPQMDDGHAVKWRH